MLNNKRYLFLFIITYFMIFPNYSYSANVNKITREAIELSAPYLVGKFSETILKSNTDLSDKNVDAISSSLEDVIDMSFETVALTTTTTVGAALAATAATPVIIPTMVCTGIVVGIFKVYDYISK